MITQVEFDGRPFWVDQENMPQWRHPISGYLFGSEWEKIQAEGLVKTMLPDWGFIDVGANFGAYSFLAATRTTAPVIAFEPEWYNHDILMKNLDSYRHAIAYHLAIADEMKVMRLELTPDQCGGHRLKNCGMRIAECGIKIRNPKSEILQGGSFQIVHCYPLDWFKLNAKAIKVDVEGTGLDVLKGGEHTVRNANLVMLEIHLVDGFTGERTQEAECVRILKEWGFEINLFQFAHPIVGIICHKGIQKNFGPWGISD